MMRSGKSKKTVSWARGRNLCQIKYFKSDDLPLEVGRIPQSRHFQEKPLLSSILRSSPNESPETCLPPPGFETIINFSYIPQIKWERPPQIVVSPDWLVAAGEESKEKHTQKQREMREFEALYPRPSDIPPSPSVSLDVEEEEDYDDKATPLVPFIEEEEESMHIPIEQEQVSMDISPEHNSAPSNVQQYLSATAPLSSGCNSSGAAGAVTPLSAGVSPRFQVDITTATALVAAIIMKSTEQGTLINLDLLMNVFNDPMIIGNLTSAHRNTLTDGSSSSNSVMTLPPVPCSTSSPAVTTSRTPPPTSATTTSLLPPVLKKPSAPSYTVLKPARDNPATQFPAATPSFPTVNYMSNNQLSQKKVVTAPVPLSSGPVSAPFTAAPPQMPPPVSWPVSTPCKPAPPPTATRVGQNVHTSNGVPAAASNPTPPPQDTVQGASKVKRAASFPSLSSPVPFTSAGNGNSNADVSVCSENTSRSTSSKDPHQLEATDSRYWKNRSTSSCSSARAETKHTHKEAHTTTAASTTTMPYHTSSSSAAVKDLSFYRNLVREDGEAKQQVKEDYHYQSGIRRSNSSQELSSARNNRQGHEKQYRSQKQKCLYFNSPRGCRNGHNCRFEHDVSVRRDERGSNERGSRNDAKRMRM